MSLSRPPLLSAPLGVPQDGEELWGLRGRGLIGGWVKTPSEAWRPEGGDVLWRPPATKLYAVAGKVEEVTTFPGLEGRAWITSQLKLRDRWLEAIRQKILSGVMQLTPALAKALGIPFDDGALLEDPREWAWADLQRRRGLGC